ncbi:MAG: HAMP domain-containing histidine kinase [Acidobacteria bacterium]|nr:HAMP domain-containing histidine kinase [Acidobacteriota bacterium]
MRPMLPRYNSPPVARPLRHTGLLVRLGVSGLAGAALCWTLGIAYEQSALGPDDDAARARLEFRASSLLRAHADELTAALRELAVALPQGEASRATDREVERPLFEAAARASRVGAAALSVTIFDDAWQPRAWAGAPMIDPPRIALAPGQPLWTMATRGNDTFLAVTQSLPRLGDSPGRLAALMAEQKVGRASPGNPSEYVLSVDGIDVTGVVTDRPLVDVAWGIDAAAVSLQRTRIRQRSMAAALSWAALMLLLMLGPMVNWRRSSESVGHVIGASAGMIVLLLVVWQILSSALTTVAIPAAPLLVTALVLAGIVATVANGLTLVKRRHQTPRVSWSEGTPLAFALVQSVAGLLSAALVIRYAEGLRKEAAVWPVEWLHFGLQPWEPARIVSLAALIILNVTVVGAGVMLLRAGTLRWALTRVSAVRQTLVLVLWGTGTLGAWCSLSSSTMRWSALLVVMLMWWLALRMTPFTQQLHRSSQATRLLALALGLVLPTLAFYPALITAANEARREHVMAVQGPAVLQQRARIQGLVGDVRAALDASPELASVLVTAPPSPDASVRPETAYRLWADTRLAQEQVTSNLELYDASGALISTFGLGLPNLTYAPPASDAGCDWQVFEEVSGFFAEERRLAHASRWVCRPDADGRAERIGAVVVHVMLDYGNLSVGGRARAATRPISLSVYGWSGRALYASASRGWPLPATVRARAQQSRTPFWVTLPAGPATQDAYVINDRAGIYLLGMPTLSALDHLLIVSEVVALGLVVLLAGLLGMSIFGMAAGRAPTSARLIVREVRASFYRKLFLTFVAATVVPVVALALVVRTYVSGVLRADIELEAIHTVTSAARIVEDITAQADLAGADDDALVVWLSRVVAQDIDLFQGATLLATSERGRFASGERPLRTPAEVYQAVQLDQAPAYVWNDRDGGRPVMSVAAPVRLKGVDALLMVPQTVRQREIDEQVAELDRRVLLAAILFIMLGASLGYRAAERVADPVGRLTRAARRIAQGEFDVRVLVTTADELRQLVEAFNGMVADLERQRTELERTNRLAAWADMARQIAHDIKNPLTPIQLSAEHLRRVHNDQGRPLGDVVDECVGGILTQVRLLRQISTEFSSFATTPRMTLAPASLRTLVDAVVDPYRAGLSPALSLLVDIPDTLPAVSTDPLLFGRALSNVVENALHAMPEGGTLRFQGTVTPDATTVALAVSDTGAGMPPEVVARLFEPYFSTKTRGTGLGLTIARRNIDACGGRVLVESAPGRGTTVTLVLPVATPADEGGRVAER